MLYIINVFDIYHKRSKMDKKIMKCIRVTKSTSKALKILAAQNDLPIGDMLTALLRFQKSCEDISGQEDSYGFKNMWEQAVLSSKHQG